MWGYNLAARNMGIRHTVMKNLQVEPQGTGTDDMENNYIYHYTFGQVTRTPTPNPAPNPQHPNPNTQHATRTRAATPTLPLTLLSRSAPIRPRRGGGSTSGATLAATPQT